MKRQRLVRKETNLLLAAKLLNRKIVDVISLHDAKNGRQIVLRLEFDDGSIVLISNSKFGMGIGWIKYNK